MTSGHREFPAEAGEWWEVAKSSAAGVFVGVLLAGWYAFIASRIGEAIGLRGVDAFIALSPIPIAEALLGGQAMWYSSRVGYGPMAGSHVGACLGSVTAWVGFQVATLFGWPAAELVGLGSALVLFFGMGGSAGKWGAVMAMALGIASQVLYPGAPWVPVLVGTVGGAFVGWAAASRR